MRAFIVGLFLVLVCGQAWAQGVPANTQIAGCVATASAPTFTQGYYGQLSCDLAGNLRTSGSGGSGSSSGSVTAGGSNGTVAQAVQGITGGVPQNINLPSTATTTTGVLEPATAAAGKIVRTSTALTAATSTTIAAANTGRIAFGVQCASGGVSVDETGATLTGASVGSGTLFIPTGTAPYFTPPIATRTAITAYTATAQTCVVTEYLR